MGLVLLLICLAISALTAAELAGRRHLLQAEIDERGAVEARLQAAADRLAAELDKVDGSPKGPWKSPPAQLAEALALLSAPSDFGVSWRQIRLGAPGAGPASQGAADDGRAVDSLFVPLRKGSSIQVARIQLQGEYRSLEGLVELLDQMPRHGVAIAELELEQHRVVLGARILARST
jgi:hypothetical protein